MKHCKHKSCKDSPICEFEISRLIPEWTRLFKSLKPQIADEYRCTDDPDDETPGMWRGIRTPALGSYLSLSAIREPRARQASGG